MIIIYEKIIKEIKPSTADKQAITDFSNKLMNIITDYASKRDVPVKCRLVGSMAKNTSLVNKADIDIFMTFPLDFPEDKLKYYGLEFGEHCISKMNGQKEIRYASHPYITGLIGKYEVDFVPCYNIKNSDQLKSAVDRTILHTDYIQRHMSDEETEQVLLLKKFMGCVNTYGANFKVGGFSGYLCELLILKYHSFIEVLSNAANKWHNMYRIDLENYGTSGNFKDPLIVIDPVDKNRNVAAALSMQKFSEFIEASRNFLKNPSRDYFSQRKINVTEKMLADSFNDRNTKCYILSFNVPHLPSDIIYPQVNKTMNSFVNVSRIYDFNVIESSYYIDSESKAHIVLEYEIDTLSNIKVHHGPLVKLCENSEDFKRKYPNAYIKDNKWIAISSRKYVTVRQMIENVLKEENLSILKLGKNIKSEISTEYDLDQVEDIIEKGNSEDYENLFLHLNPNYRLYR